MTNRAALELRLVLINERPLFVRVALIADLIVAVGPAKLTRLETSMRVMAIGALNQSFVDPVVKRPSEFRAHVQVAGVAELRRGFLEQELALFGVVRRMAVIAGNSALEVRGAREIVLLVAALVAAQAASAGLLRCRVLEGEDFGFVATAVDVLFSRAVASLAAMPFHAFVRVELRVHGGGEVGRRREMRIEVLMACLTGVGTDVEAGIRRWSVEFDLLGRLGLLCSLLFVARMDKGNCQRRDQNCQEIGNGESRPILHRTPLAIPDEIPVSTRILLHLLSLDEQNNLKS